MRRVVRGLALFWIAVTAILLLAIAGHVLAEPGFPLGLGFIETRGLAGLWATLLPAAVGLGAVVLLWRSSRVGAGLLLAYSAFWSLVLATLVPGAGRESGVGLAVVLILLTPFLLIGAWSCRILASGKSTGR